MDKKMDKPLNADKSLYVISETLFNALISSVGEHPASKVFNTLRLVEKEVGDQDRLKKMLLESRESDDSSPSD